MRYYPIRVIDERSSELCEKIEHLAEAEGGLEFPFEIDGYYYDEDTLETSAMNSAEYYTHVFHSNCRCRLVPVSEDGDVVQPGKELDELDRLMLVDGAMAESAVMQMAASEDVSEKSMISFLNGRAKIKTVTSMSAFGRSRVDRSLNQAIRARNTRGRRGYR